MTPERPIRRLRRRLSLVLCAALALAASPGGASPAAPAPDDSYRQEIAGWQRERAAGLAKDDGWLTLVGLFWLQEGENGIGSGADNRVILPEKAPARVGRLVRQGRSVRLEADPATGVMSEGKPVTSLALTSDADGKPTVLRLGSLSFFVIERGERVGVRVKDNASPSRTRFKGLDYFPLDPSWRVEARFEPNKAPKTIPIPNVLGSVEPSPSPGTVVFEHGGRTLRLDALEGDDGGLFLIFGDPTNGKETYGAGRFLDTEAPKNGRVVVDFNRSYNPPCAFTAFATCPLPPRQNKLAVPVLAGEKKYGTGHPET
jgi:uncharacterized protein